MNSITEDRLQDLFTTGKWQNLFAALSETLGFSLSLYSETGKPVFFSGSAHPSCKEFHSQSPDIKFPCEARCHRFLMNILRKGKPRVFRCYAKIMCFALPVEYGDEKAVILGQGGFSSFKDFRECMDQASSFGIDTTSITTPLKFTTSKHAWKVCGFVADSVNRLLGIVQETAVLRKKFESLKNVIGTWGAAAEEQPETPYQEMVSRLSSLLDIECIALVAVDRRRGQYVGFQRKTAGCGPVEVLGISERDEVVQDLRRGRPYVLSTEPVKDPAAGLPIGTYFFPVTVNGNLEGILRITSGVLQEGDIEIITAFCRKTAIAIENRRLYRDQSLKCYRFAAVSEMMKTIAPIQNHEALLRAVLDKSAELLQAEQGSLMLLDHETNHLHLGAKKGTIESISEKIRIPRGEGIAGKVAELGEAILVENLESDPRTRQKNRHNYKTRSFVSVPLMIEDRVIGVLSLADKTTGEVFDKEDLELMQSVAAHAVIALERNVFYNKTEELKKLTITDHLTGLLNRRYLHERLKDELARSRRYGHRLSLLMLDLDGFKKCNDIFGHLFGDQTLVVIAESLLNAVRSMDVVARYGGDEFMIILPETGEPMATDIAERLRRTVEEKAVLSQEAAGAGPRTLSASIGIACFPEHGDTIELLIENVDKALYSAKNNGKNRIEVFS